MKLSKICTSNPVLILLAILNGFLAITGYIAHDFSIGTHACALVTLVIIFVLVITKKEC